jgi:hypothetical protein
LFISDIKIGKPEIFGLKQMSLVAKTKTHTKVKEKEKAMAKVKATATARVNAKRWL